MRFLFYSCFLLLLFGTLNVSAQDFNNYQPARCSGEVPEEFRKLSSEKAKDAIAEVNNKKMGRHEKRDEKNYAITANFLVDELLSSGQILFGDPMSDFVNKVADVLLETESELRNELRFYVYRSAIPNAYATHTGVILISVGLLARVENEAQMACILAHEIQHYVKKHSLQQYKKAVQMKRELGGITKVEMDEVLKEMYRFSKEAESEADLLGFRLLQKTKYNMHEGLAVFDMLRYTEYPFLEITLTADSLETEYYKFPEEVKESIVKLLSKKPIGHEEEDDEDDENSTHPSLTKRIDKLREILEAEAIPESGNNFLISEKVFLDIQRQARCELLSLYIRNGDFGKVIYLSRVMELVYGKTLFTDKTEAMGWYGLAFHKIKMDDLDNYGCNTRYAVGDWRPLLALFKSLKSKEITALAMRELYLAAEAHPGDKWFENRRNKLFELAQSDEELSLYSFLNYSPPVISDTAKTEARPEEPAVKNPRNRRKTASGSGEAVPYYYAALYSVTNKDSLREYMTGIEFVKPADEDIIDDKYKKKKKKQFKDPPVVVHALALFEPAFNQYDISGKGEKKKLFFDEEQMIARLTGKLQKMGNLNDMPVTIVSGNNSAALTIDDINRYMVLNDWFIERMNNDTNSMELWNGEYADPMMSDMGTDYLAWVGFRYTIKKRPFDASTFLVAIFAYPVFPIYLVWQLSREKEFSYISVVFNTKTGALSSVQSDELSHRMKRDFMNAQLYKMMYNIKHGKVAK